MACLCLLAALIEMFLLCRSLFRGPFLDPFDVFLDLFRMLFRSLFRVLDMLFRSLCSILSLSPSPSPVVSLLPSPSPVVLFLDVFEGIFGEGMKVASGKRERP